MPVFEYKCSDCNEKFEVLYKSSVHKEEITCPKCNSTKNKKLYSAFSASVVGSSVSNDSCTTGSCGVPSSYDGCASGMCGLN